MIVMQDQRHAGAEWMDLSGSCPHDTDTLISLISLSDRSWCQAWSCIDTNDVSQGNAWGCHVILTMGYLVALVLTLPMGYFNLDDNMIIQVPPPPKSNAHCV